MGHEQRLIDLGAVSLPVAEEGRPDAAPVLLLHGFPQTAAAWRTVMGPLAARGHRVIAPTQRGNAPGMPSRVEAYAMPRLVADVIRVLDALDIERSHLVGHDWGGSVAWQVAARHPQRVRSLTVLSTPHPVALGRALRSSRAAQLRFGYAALLRLRGSERVLGAADALLLRRWMRLTGLPADADLITDPATLRTALHWYRAFSGAALKDLPRITVPTLYLYGRRDPVFTLATARASGRWCDGPYALTEVPDGGHWLAQTHPDLVVDALHAHLHAHG